MEPKDPLKQEYDFITNQLSKPEVYSDYKKVAEFSKRLSEIDRLMNPQVVVSEQKPGNEAIMEIRAGTGGDEAALFAGDLYSMYKKYAQIQGWQVDLLDQSLSGLGGYKTIIFEISGKEAFNKLKNESGVHRVQRIPETEKAGRVHTSTATVAVLPKAKESDIEIRSEDLEISFFRSSGPGGQNVNKVETAVRITHKPTGVIVSSQEGRSQYHNRLKAMEVLRTKLVEAKREADSKEMTDERRKQIGTADRSEKIRTYNFPQDRLTDHRIKKNWGNLSEIMEGKMDKVIEAFYNKE